MGKSKSAINIKIAEIKNEHGYQLHKDGVSIRLNTLSDSQKKCVKVKNWSGKLDDAWELFKELPNADLSMCDEENMVFAISFVLTLPGDVLGELEHEFSAVPQIAICKAWMKWKQRMKKGV